MLEILREEVYRLHLELPRNHLVAWTSGNVSARDAQTDLVVIKPSGVPYEELSPDKLVVVDLHGRVVEGDLKPSSDTASHLYIYRQKADVHGIVHTHSPYATAFAAAGKPLPVYITEIAEEFGGSVPCSDFALIGDDAMGRQVVEHMGHCPAVLLKQHGVMTTGKTASHAVELAVLIENCARIVLYARQLGEVNEIPADAVAQLYYRQSNVYGQS